MSFLGIGKSIHPMRPPAPPASSPHRLDEFPAGYSLAGCAPALPASASPTASEYALKSSCRSIAFHRTVNSALTVCLTPGGRSTVQPGLLSSAKEFTERFEHTTANLEELKRALLFQQPHAFLLRRNKSDIAELPPKHLKKISCETSGTEIELHLQLLEELRGGQSQTSIFRVLHKFALLSQHPALLAATAEDISPEELIAASPKLRAVIRELHNIRGKQEKAIIFARHRAMQSILAKVLSSEFHLPMRIINGDTRTKSSSFRAQGQQTRNGILDEFKRKPGFGVLILSPFVAGIGLTI